MLGTELRYAPVPGTTGSVLLDLFQDLDQHHLPGGRGYGGLRGVGHLTHRTESGAGVFAAQGIAASDVMAVRDQTAHRSRPRSISSPPTWGSGGPAVRSRSARMRH